MAPYSSIVKKNSGGPSGSLTSEDTESSSGGEEEPETSAPLGPYPSVGSSTIPAAARQTTSQQGHQQVQQEFPLQELNEKSSLEKVPAGASLVQGRVGQDGRLPAHQSPAAAMQAEALYPFPMYTKGLSGRESPYLERKVLLDELSQKEAWPLIPDAPSHKHLSKDEGGMPPYSTPSTRTSMIYAAVMSSQSSVPSPSSSKPPSDLLFPSTPRPPNPSDIDLHMFHISQQERMNKTHTSGAPQSNQPSSSEGAREALYHLSHTLPQPQLAMKSVAVLPSPSQILEDSRPLLDKGLVYDHHLASGVASTRTTLQHQFHSTGPLATPPLFVPSSISISPSVRPSSDSPKGVSAFMPSSNSPHYSTPGLPYSAHRTFAGNTGSAHHHNYSLYANSGYPISSSLGLGGAAPGDSRATSATTCATSSMFPATTTSTAVARIMEGVYEATSADAPVYVSPHSLLSVLPEKSQKNMADNPAPSSKTVPAFTTQSSVTLTGQLAKTASALVAKTTSPSQAHPALKKVLSPPLPLSPPPPPPPVLVDVLTQTDLTGTPAMEDAETATSGVYVAQDELTPPSLSLDSLGKLLVGTSRWEIVCIFSIWYFSSCAQCFGLLFLPRLPFFLNSFRETQ